MRGLKVLLVLATLVLPALAGRDLSNRSGAYNGEYIAEVKILEEDKEDRIVKNVHIVLRERYVDLYFSDTQKDTGWLDQMYAVKGETQITAKDVNKEIRYFITIPKDIGHF